MRSRYLVISPNTYYWADMAQTCSLGPLAMSRILSLRLIHAMHALTSMYLITVLVEDSTDSTVSLLTRIVSLHHCIAILIVFLLQVIMTMASSTVFVLGHRTRSYEDPAPRTAIICNPYILPPRLSPPRRWWVTSGDLYRPCPG